MRYFKLLVLGMFVIGVVHAKSQPNLDAAQKGLQTEYGKQVWAEQMNGDEPKITQSTIDGLTNKAIAKELLHEDAKKYAILQLIKWPLSEGQYLFLAKKTDFENDCARLFLFKMQDGQIKPLSELTKAQTLCGLSAKILFAPVALGGDKQGFSLLTTDGEGYAGGGADESQLSIVEIANNQLELRLTTLHGSFKNIAGEWHKNGTRSHDISEESCTVFADKKTIVNGYYVFKKHCVSSENGSKPKTSSKAIFKYSSSKSMYESKSSNESSVLQKSDFNK